MRTFEDFVVCSSNEAAYRAARKREPNPLFIEGPRGSGKSHLLEAIAHEARSEGRTVDHLTVRAFVHRLIRSYLLDITGDPADVLLIDDFGLIPDGSATYEGVLREAARQAERGLIAVVASHRKLPESIQPVQLGYPDATAAKEIARRAAIARGCVLNDRELVDVAREQQNPRAIEGIVTRMAFARTLTF